MRHVVENISLAASSNSTDRQLSEMLRSLGLWPATKLAVWLCFVVALLHGPSVSPSVKWGVSLNIFAVPSSILITSGHKHDFISYPAQFNAVLVQSRKLREIFEGIQDELCELASLDFLFLLLPVLFTNLAGSSWLSHYLGDRFFSSSKGATWKVGSSAPVGKLSRIKWKSD